MKYYFIILLLIFFKPGYSQNIKNIEVTEVTNTSIAKLLTPTAIERIPTEKGNKLAIRIFDEISHDSSQDDEKSRNLLITVSEYDNSSVTKIFSVGPFINPNILRKKDSGSTFIIILQTENDNKRKNHKIIVHLNKVVYH